MKSFKLHFLVVAAFFMLLTSCEKEYPYPSDSYGIVLAPIDNSPAISLWGKFRVISGVMYVDNKETGERFVFDHFGPNKDTSSLRWGGSQFDIETIVKNQTTYSFYQPVNYPGYGKFELNSDSTKHYAVYFIGQNKTIVEDPVYGMTQQLMGGSSRPFSGQTVDYANKIVRMQIQEMEGSINGYNCHYWSELTLEKIEEW